MKKSQFVEITGGLSRPEKMPGGAYSLPASACRVGSQLRAIPDSTCADCYACKGRYSLGTVQQALQRRLASIGGTHWVAAMVELIAREPVPFFRWHDSGDIQNLRHLVDIVRIAEALPEIKFWLPTRELSIVSSYLAAFGELPDNLCVRLSAPLVDRPLRSSLPLPTSTVHDTLPPIGFPCGAASRGNRCGDCRACWDTAVSNISYPKH